MASVQPGSPIYETIEAMPLWRYGYRWSVLVALNVARIRKAKGGDIVPSLPEKYDIDRDIDIKLALDQLSDKACGYSTAEGARAIDIYQWAKEFLQIETGLDGVGQHSKQVHTGVAGKKGAGALVIWLVCARAPRLSDISLEPYREAGQLPEGRVLAILREYLGEPEWFLDWDDLKRKNLLSSLEAGTFQAQVGILVRAVTDPTPHAQ